MEEKIVVGDSILDTVIEKAMTVISECEDYKTYKGRLSKKNLMNKLKKDLKEIVNNDERLILSE